MSISNTPNICPFGHSPSELPTAESSPVAPTTWEELVVFAEGAIKADLPYDQQIAAAGMVLNVVENLDNETSELALHSAQVKVCRLIEPELVEPEKRTAFALAAAAELAKKHPGFCERNSLAPGEGLYISMLPVEIERMPNNYFGATVREQYRALPMSERLAAEALQVARRNRVERVQMLDGMESRGDQLTRILTKDSIVEAVLQDTFAGATILLFENFALRANQSKPEDLMSMPISRVFRLEELQELISARTARTGAAVRRDQARIWDREGVHRAFASLSAAGALALDRASIPRQPGPVPLPVKGEVPLLHEAVLGCPALKVGDLVPSASRVLTMTIVETQKLLGVKPSASPISD